ncbi:signal recognition particle protein [PVC group bacterium (ex Bugula neritina AB1)]|nr:signal recognition particle protein [PVC group bacterium (ex Bugula neritina AB1)]
MFDSLGDKFNNVFRYIRGTGKMSEKNIDEAVRSVKMALLEADVDYKVVKDFVADVKKRVIGQEVTKNILPEQQFVKIIHEELTEIMGKSNIDLTCANIGTTYLMVVGIQGSGKTTACGKLAFLLQSQKKKVLLVSTDIRRPAAITQLKILAKKANASFFDPEGEKDPCKIVKNVSEYVRHKDYDYVIFDTAGRLELDEPLMKELTQIKIILKPHEILFVADSMMGQSALKVARSFDENIGVDGVILNKLDGDTRGGVALSVKKVLGKPIKFMGLGEKLVDLEVFHPERLASRILGMGDVVSLVEKAKKTVGDKEAEYFEKKIRKANLDFDDFLRQLQYIKKMGSLKDILAMLPGANKLKNIPTDDKQMVHVEAMILSMTPYERQHPHMINPSRRKRIAKGSGCEVNQVNRLLKQFETMKKMMKKVTQGKSKDIMKNMMSRF